VAFDAFLKLEGVDGESSFSKHKNWIEIESWSWGEKSSDAGGSGAPVEMNLRFTKTLDKSSPVLMQACCTGQHFAKATISCRKITPKSNDIQDYLQYKFTDVVISNYVGKGSDDKMPKDEVSFNFSKIEFDYRMPKRDGSLGPLVHGECFEK
jgi:type VI secretion system secreted protein Hcp